MDISNSLLFDVYNGDSPYFAAFCAKNDFNAMMQILNPLNQKGFNIWYDAENFNSDSLGNNSLFKFLDPACRVIFIFISAESENSKAILRLFSYMSKFRPDNVYCVMLNNSEPLSSSFSQRLKPLKKLKEENMKTYILSGESVKAEEKNQEETAKRDFELDGISVLTEDPFEIKDTPLEQEPIQDDFPLLNEESKAEPEKVISEKTIPESVTNESIEITESNFVFEETEEPTGEQPEPEKVISEGPIPEPVTNESIEITESDFVFEETEEPTGEQPEPEEVLSEEPIPEPVTDESIEPKEIALETENINLTEEKPFSFFHTVKKEKENIAEEEEPKAAKAAFLINDDETAVQPEIAGENEPKAAKATFLVNADEEFGETEPAFEFDQAENKVETVTKTAVSYFDEEDEEVLKENKPASDNKETDESSAVISNDHNFTYDKNVNGISVKKYTGNKPDIKIPSFVDGEEINEISGFAFSPDSPIVVEIPPAINNIAVSAFTFKNDNVTIKCQKNSYAHNFAEEHKIKYKITSVDIINEVEDSLSAKAVGFSDSYIPSSRKRRNLRLEKMYKEPYIYVSFAQRDFSKVRQVIEKLSLKGIRIYIPEHYDNLTEDEIAVISNQIANSRYFLAFITENYTIDKLVSEIELKAAESSDAEYLPIIFDDGAEIPKVEVSPENVKEPIKKSDFENIDAFTESIAKCLNQCCGSLFMNTGDFRYKIENNRAIIKKYLGKEQKVVINSTYLDTPVTEIGEFAFSNCSSVREIIIPNSVDTIRSFAFSGCSMLKSVKFPDRITSMGSFVFRGCKFLKSVDFPKGIKCIPDNTFEECTSLEKVTISETVTSIENYAFKGCVSLTEVTIPPSVKTIKDYAFSRCSGLSEKSLSLSGDVNVSPTAFKNYNDYEDNLADNNQDYYNQDIYENKSIAERIKDHIIRLMYK